MVASYMDTMSVHAPAFNGAHISNRADGLKVWSCVSCRRRKVRCDRRHPCAPCTRNKSDCIFPMSGRVPRRGRTEGCPDHQSQKQEVLLGRLRRLEAMVGDLGSQVEQVATANQGSHPSDNPTNATTASSSEQGWQDYELDPYGQSASQDPRNTREVQLGFGVPDIPSESPQDSDEFGELVLASDGDLVVADRFWTVFCKEVCCSSVPFTISTGWRQARHL